MTLPHSQLFEGDALMVMDHLLGQGAKGKVDLVVTDPPFFTRREQRLADHAYSDEWDSLSDYLGWLREIIMRSHQLLNDAGSMFLHLDWHAVHHARVIMDEIFGAGGEACAPGFRNEIIWCYTGPGSPGMGQFNRKHDTILWYSKGAKWTFNRDAIRIPHSTKTKANFRGDLGGSGFENPGYELDESGKIPEDWWQIPVAARFPIDGKTRVGYPTEKPVALVERIIHAASNPGDLVVDFLCGGGTVPSVAQRLERRWWAGDANPTAVALTKGRIESLGSEVTISRIGAE